MTVENKYIRWQKHATEDKALQRLLVDMAENEQEKKECFSQTLAFGTGGLRGVLGAGTNRMNIYTVRGATQGFADFLTEQYENPKIAIAYDSRHYSQEFAKQCAMVMAANGVQVHLFAQLMPTPVLSFAVRALGCSGGIMITASHNPAKYNGYKAYDHNGCQLTDGPAKAVMEKVAKVDVFDHVKTMGFEKGLSLGKICYIPEETQEAYYQAVLAQRVQDNKGQVAGLQVVYTPLHGAGLVPVREICSRIGLANLHIVKAQELPDGDFTTCPYPNPEVPEAMALSFALAKEKGADIVLATDPDSDRAGLGVSEGAHYRLLTGNEIGILLLDYLMEMKKQQNTLRPKDVVIKTIVSSKMVDAICRENGLVCKDVLTGFKYIGEQIAALEKAGEESRFLFGYEESYGYLSGSYVRDKDAVLACMLLVQMAAHYKAQGMSLLHRLEALYETYGHFLNHTDAFAFEGLKGMEKMEKIMENLRKSPFAYMAGDKVVQVQDYLQGGTGLPKSNVLSYTLESGTTVIIRPSGTEPKVKTYFSIQGKSREICEKTLRQMQAFLEKYLK